MVSIGLLTGNGQQEIVTCFAFERGELRLDLSREGNTDLLVYAPDEQLDIIRRMFEAHIHMRKKALKEMPKNPLKKKR